MPAIHDFLASAEVVHDRDKPGHNGYGMYTLSERALNDVEQIEQDNHGYRDTQKPEQYAAHDGPPCTLRGGT